MTSSSAVPVLTGVEARVLGALIEKEITTPDYYPLSMNALLNACNQKSNRDPVTEFDEDTVRQALHGLDDKGLAGAVRGFDSRVTKYEHRFSEAFNFGRREVAVLCVLLLRGPQTPGELRSRSDRLYSFDELSDVQATLQKLIDREPPLVRTLPRQPGTKEARSMHLFCGDTYVADFISSGAGSPSKAEEIDGSHRLQSLEEQVAALRQEVLDLRGRVDAMSKSQS
ncbi:Protein of unknown function YceH [Acidisarcina polymorpha]|uniref:Uncharacterized protein n=1 Tax=Acidisarcina polymorpha TaxID=2211140 RepID=A0A2Z5FVX2_9BACT|nr:YceH family protein [Acidisarcina polymorpha]AXC10525.1 Protein of unknown function YceH [Acidisarcina polymorpha]